MRFIRQGRHALPFLFTPLIYTLPKSYLIHEMAKTEDLIRISKWALFRWREVRIYYLYFVGFSRKGSIIYDNQDRGLPFLELSNIDYSVNK